MKPTLILFVLALDAAVAAETAALPQVRQVFETERWSAGNTNVRPLQPIDDAAWIWHPGEPLWGESAMASDAWQDECRGGSSPFYRFRREFDGDGGDLRFDVSADERFVLLLDGRPVARGPHRGLVSHWYYQSYLVTGLAPGRHVLEAVCWQLGGHSPLAQLSWRGGFVLRAGGAYDRQLTTGRAAWRSARLVNTVMTDRGTSRTFGAGSQCEIRGTSFLDEVPAEAEWRDAVTVRPPVVRNPYGGRANGWMLFPTERLDQLHEAKTPGQVVNAAADLTKPFTVPANSELDCWWDLGDYYSAYPELRVSGGAGATVTWGWTESLREPTHRKGNRDEWRGKEFSQTFTDTFRCDGRGNAFFTSPWWRCGRWCRLRFRTGAEPLRVERVELAESRYPISADFAFECDDPEIAEIVRICRRSLENCTHEMLMDCPYYEQQMYPGDSRIELDILNAFTRDDRMNRFVMSVFDYDRRSDGMVAMNFPTRGTQESPTYTLCWTLMFRDYLRWHGGSGFLRARMPGVRNALEGIALYEDGDGLLRDLPGWNFMDWAREWRREDESGVPPGGHLGDEPGAVVNLLYLHALRAAAEVDSALGETELAAHWRRRAERLGRKTVERFWCAEKGALADDAAGAEFSEHAQCLAILGGILAPADEARAARTLLEDPGLVRCSTYFAYYLFETYAKLGRADLILKRFDDWRVFLKHGARTAFETQNPEARSDCHAWSASPIVSLATVFAGVTPAAPGFTSVRVAPQPGGLRWLRAAVPCPQGAVRVDLRFEDGSVNGEVALPPGLPGTFEWRGCSEPLAAGATVRIRR